MQPYVHSDHLLVIAGGSGAGWTLPFIEDFITYRSTPTNEECGQAMDEKEEGDTEARRSCKWSTPSSLRLILATRDMSSKIWYTRAVTKLLADHAGANSLSKIQIQVHLTGEAEQDIESINVVQEPSSSSEEQIPLPEKGSDVRDQAEILLSVDECKGRPQLPSIVREAAGTVSSGESLGVYVCGPTTMQNDVRNAVADVNLNILKGSKSGGAYLHCEHFAWA